MEFGDRSFGNLDSAAVRDETATELIPTCADVRLGTQQLASSPPMKVPDRRHPTQHREPTPHQFSQKCPESSVIKSRMSVDIGHVSRNSVLPPRRFVSAMQLAAQVRDTKQEMQDSLGDDSYYQRYGQKAIHKVWKPAGKDERPPQDTLAKHDKPLVGMATTNTRSAATAKVDASKHWEQYLRFKQEKQLQQGQPQQQYLQFRQKLQQEQPQEQQRQRQGRTLTSSYSSRRMDTWTDSDDDGTLQQPVRKSPDLGVRLSRSPSPAPRHHFHAPAGSPAYGTRSSPTSPSTEAFRMSPEDTLFFTRSNPCTPKSVPIESPYSVPGWSPPPLRSPSAVVPGRRLQTPPSPRARGTESPCSGAWRGFSAAHSIPDEEWFNGVLDAAVKSVTATPIVGSPADSNGFMQPGTRLFSSASSECSDAEDFLRCLGLPKPFTETSAKITVAEVCTAPEQEPEHCS